MTGKSVSAEELLGTLSKDKAELLKRLLEEKSRQQQKIRRFPREAGPEGARVATSWSQQRLWFIDELEGGTAGYYIPLAVRLKGVLDRTALERALNALVERHEVLRTVFVSVDGEPRQQILPKCPIALHVIDLSDRQREERESHVRLQQSEETSRKFNLRSGPLVRACLLRLAQDEHVLLVTMHHIVSDGWSVGVALRELSALYGRFRDGKEDTLQALPIQYADYAQWQREWLQGELSARQLGYWRDRLAGAPPELTLPTDRARPPAQSYRGENVKFGLDASLVRRLRALAHGHDMTLFMVLYAGWAVLLSRLSGLDDIVVGTPVANRQRPELESLIGFFVNTVVLRAGVDTGARLEEFLARVRETTLGAYANQDVPFEKIVEVLQPQRSLGRNPIFQVMFALHNVPRSELRFAGLGTTPEDMVDEPAVFDLFVSLEEQGDEVSGYVNYATDLFDGETIQRWMACYTVLLEAMPDGARSLLGELPILPAAERRRIDEFNATAAPFPRDALIHQLFENEARLHPDAEAVRFAGDVLSYGELDRRANRLASYLVARGVGPDARVGVCVERSIDLVVAVLATLKAGGAYVPLDPNYPAERLHYMLEDAAPKIVLTSEELRAKLPATQSEVVVLGEKLKELVQSTDPVVEPPTVGLSPRDLVYVIYTSGSTGKPKGIAMPHGSMVNLIEWHRRTLPFQSSRRALQFAALSFDVAFQEIFSTLCTGGTLVLLNEWTRRDAGALLQLLASESVERLFLPPLMLQSLAESFRSLAAPLPELRDVITAGEQLRISPEIVGFFSSLPECRLHNHYGPTETHVVTALTLADTPDRWPVLPSIGRPVSNCQIHVLDHRHRPVPIGASGEIYIGGANVARGYLHRPELTAQRFVEDPFSSDTSTRLYRTGDVGCWRADGTIDYLGRNDDQVKIRGYRIELGEIEAQLARHEDVREAAVVARTNDSGQKALVAYLTTHEGTTREGTSPAVEAFRAHLKALLPDYMVPSAFVILDALPLTPSGKLDRRSLPAPDMQAYSVREYEEPQGELERSLAQIWRDLLKVERVGRQDNFFELGGHSLLIVQMKERLRRVGLNAEVRNVYESGTLADLAGRLTAESSAGADIPPNRIPPAAPRITPDMLTLIDLAQEQIDRIVRTVPGGARNVQDIYPLTPLQEGILFHHLLNEQSGDVYVVTTVLSLASRQRLDDFIVALQGVIDRHDILRTAVLWEDLPLPLQVVYREARLPVEEVALASDREVDEQLREWTRPERQRLDLRQAPLMRLHIAANPRGEEWFGLLQLHHLTHDHDAMETMFAEVMTCLAGRARTLAPAMPYRNHVAQSLSHARLNDAEAFFRDKLGDIDESTAPFGLLDVHGDGSQIAIESVVLDPSVGKRIRTQSRRLGVSAATFFHAAWGLVIARLCDREDIVFGTLLSGRLQGSAGGQQVLGMFINTLPLRLKLQGSARELIEQTHRELVQLLGHEQASLAIAQRCSGIAGATPLFTSLLNYRHSAVDLDREFGRGGVKLRAIHSVTNYPVTFGVDDRGESFALDMETDQRIDPKRAMGYVLTTIEGLVKALETSPQAPLPFCILPESERHEVLFSFNDTEARCPRHRLIHEIFEERVEEFPDAPAVVYAGQSLTYDQLNKKANQLARYLRSRGVGPDARVGLCVERGLDMVVGMLAILKAGGAYVPLDPAYPADRLAYMLEDAAPPVLLTQRALVPTLPDTAVQIVAMDDDWSRVSHESDGNLEAAAIGLTSSNLAYVIYTSGSTGRPKGVMVEHRNLVSLWQSLLSVYVESDEPKNIAVNASFNFDASVKQFVQLMSGRTIFPVPQEIRLDASLMLAFIADNRIEAIDCTPSQLRTWVAEGMLEKSVCAPRMVLIGGEAIDPQLWSTLAAHRGSHFWNIYGPTECTVDATVARVTADTSVPHIGRPMQNKRVYILDRNRAPAPVGVVGELFIGGAGVARGYLNQLALTEQRFLSDPFDPRDESRMYRTGDVGRWRAHGTIEYLGRNDAQVKLRGYRIELGEIEARLCEHALVGGAAVIVREDTPGEQRLVAYVTARGPEAPRPEDLRTQLKSGLPDYMVPGAFVVLDTLPLTPSGKLNRRALPVPEAGACLSKDHDPPRGDVEEALATIWCELLHIERVGRADNFFEMGGHSLHAMRLVGKVTARFGVRLSVSAAFRHPTIEEMARVVEAESETEELQEGVI